MTRGWKILILLLVILLLASFLRIYSLDRVPPGLYSDEAMNGNNAREALATGDFKVFYTENNGREGLFINIQALFIGLRDQWGFLGPIELLRLPSAIFGILTVLGVYFLTNELFRENSKSEALNSKQIQNSNVQNSKRFWSIRGHPLSQNYGHRMSKNWDLFRTSNLGFSISHGGKIALLAAFLIAINFWHINFSRIGFRAIMAPFFLAWGLYLLLLSFRKAMSLRLLKYKNPKSETLNSKQIQNSNVQNSKRFWSIWGHPMSQNYGHRMSKNWDLFRTSNLGFIILPILAGLVYGLGMHSYIAYRATPLLILFIFWVFWRQAKKNGYQKQFSFLILSFLFSAFVVVLPLGLYFLENPADFFGRTSQISVWQSATPFKDLGLNILKTAGMFNIIGDWNPRHNLPGEPLLYWPVGILFLVGLFLAIKNIIQKSKIKNENDNLKFKNYPPLADTKTLHFAFYILILWLIISAIPVVISNEGIPHALRSILMAPPIFILAATGGIWFYEFIKSKFKTQDLKLLSASILLLGILLAFQVYNEYFVKWARRTDVADAFNQKYVQIGDELNELPRELPKYVVIDTGGFDVRAIGTPAQTIMYITDTFLPERQKEKNIFYIQPSQVSEIAENSFVINL